MEIQVVHVDAHLPEGILGTESLDKLMELLGVDALWPLHE
jgi:hypothetical protein